VFTASLGGNYQIAAITALILLVPSIAFMLLIERFLNTEMLAKVGWSNPDRAARSKWFQPRVGERQSLDAVAATNQRRRAAGDGADKMIELAAVRLSCAACACRYQRETLSLELSPICPRCDPRRTQRRDIRSDFPTPLARQGRE
jgi:hypothetical protein